MERERERWRTLGTRNLIKDPHRAQPDTLTHMRKIVPIQSKIHGVHTEEGKCSVMILIYFLHLRNGSLQMHKENTNVFILR